MESISNNIKKDLNSIYLTFIFQILLLLIFLFDFIGLNFPEIVRTIIGLIYLTFIPGFLILTILKLKEIVFIEKILLSVGLSIAFLLFSGLILNILGPVFGITNPLSKTPLFIMMLISFFIFSIIIYKKNPIINVDQNKQVIKKLKEYIHPKFLNPIMFLFIVLILSIIGPILVNDYSLNIVQLILIIFLSLIVFFVAFNIFIPSKIYLLAVGIISLSLILHWTLISEYLVGTDIQVEFYIYSLVEKSSYWDHLIYPNNTNSMLSVTIFPSFFSKLFNINNILIFKFLYSLIFSLIPMGLYITYRKNFSKKIAFLSAFYFMSLSSFFSSNLGLAKQIIAMFFLTLIFMITFNEKINPFIKSIMLVIFFSSLVVSHYGTSYLFLLIYLFFIIIYYFGSKSKMIYKQMTLTITLFIFITILTFSWYIYTTQSSLLFSITNIFQMIYYGFSNDLFSISSREVGRAIISESGNLLFFINRLLYLSTIFFIILGVLSMFISNKKKIINIEFFYLGLSSFIIFITLAIAPNFSGFDFSRIRQITTIFLSPFLVLGMLNFFNIFIKLSYILKEKNGLRDKLNKFVNILISKKTTRILLKLSSLILILFFLFTTKFVFEITDNPSSITMDDELDYTKYNKKEYNAALWLTTYHSSQNQILTDHNGFFIFIPLIGDNKEVKMNELEKKPILDQSIQNETYLFFRQINIEEDKVLVLIFDKWPKEFDYITVEELEIIKEQKLYDNAGSQISLI